MTNVPSRLRPLPLFGAALLSALLATAPAAAWDVRDNPPPDDFRAFHERFSSAAYAYPRHGAAPLGITGFEIYADATYDDGFDDEPFAETVLDDDLTGGFLSVGRVGGRKGLPWGIDLGLSYGQALGGDIELISGEVQVALLRGGVVQPALSVRLTGTQTQGSSRYELDQYGAELLLSKGFTVVTPYIGAGVVYSKGRLGDLEEDSTDAVIYAGATLNLLLKITLELEKGEVVQGAVRVGFGL
jgi:opacity protein-like surface antigen